MDWFHSMAKFLDYNRGIVFGLLIAAALAAGIIGCQPKTQSLLTPPDRVTATQLEREIVIVQADIKKREAKIVSDSSELEADIAAVNEQVDAAVADIERQVELRKTIITAVGAIGADVAAGTITPAGAVNAVISLLLIGSTGGLALDNLRKSRVIREQKNGTPA